MLRYGSNYNAMVSQQLLFVPLISLSKQDTIDYSRSLAESITASANGTSYDIKLNPKWMWSDGTPVTAQDVVFFVQLALHAAAKGSPLPYSDGGVGGVPTLWKSVGAVGTHEVKVTLTRPVNPTWFEFNGLSQIMPVPKSVWDKYPSDWTKELNFIKSLGNQPTAPEYKVIDGPYAIDSIQPKQQYSFSANPNFSGHAPSIKKFILKYFTSDSSEYAALKTGQIQVGYLPATDYGQPAIPGYKSFSYFLYATAYTYVNYHPKAPGKLASVVAQKYVREALQRAINQPAVIKGIFKGQGEQMYTTIPQKPSTQFFDAKLSAAPYPYDPAAGKKLLENHGWKEVGGVMTKGDVKLEFKLYYPSGIPAVKQSVELWQAGAAQEGIKLDLTAQPFPTFVNTLQTPDSWNLAAGLVWSYQPDYFPSGDGLFNTGGGNNFGGYSNQTLDHLIQATIQPASKDATLKAMFAYESFMANELPVLWNANAAHVEEVASYVHGVEANNNPIMSNDPPQFWTISK